MTDTTPWSHAVDFTKTDGGWQAVLFDGGAPGANWIAGSGWHSTDFTAGGVPCRCVVVQNVTPISLLTQVQIEFNYTLGGAPVPAPAIDIIVNGVFVFNIDMPYSNGHHVETWDGAIANVTQVRISLQACTDIPPCYSGEALLIKCTLSGIGVNPFITHNGPAHCPFCYAAVDMQDA